MLCCPDVPLLLLRLLVVLEVLEAAVLLLEPTQQLVLVELLHGEDPLQVVLLVLLQQLLLNLLTHKNLLHSILKKIIITFIFITYVVFVTELVLSVVVLLDVDGYLVDLAVELLL